MECDVISVAYADWAPRNENIQYLQWDSNMNAEGILIEPNCILNPSTELLCAVGLRI